LKEEWESDFAARAAAYWTKERTQKLVAGKKLPLMPGEAGTLLRALGLVNRDASMSADAVRKYMQINHMVALLEPAMVDLCKAFPTVRVLDAGCGSSYLTYLLAWCFIHRWKHPAQILGVDRNEKVIQKCRERMGMVGLDAVLRFEAGPIAELDFVATWARAFGGEPDANLRPHALVALHACDTATDDALALALRLRADFVAAAPCCQAELARKWSELAAAHQEGAFAPVWNAAHLRRDVGASMTDTLRTLLLRGCGYEVTPMEFVPSTHTPKNTLLRAVRRGNYRREALVEYLALRGAIGGVGIALEASLPEEHRARLAQMEREAARIETIVP
jgi:SAM-dependent methyltransferase